MSPPQQPPSPNTSIFTPLLHPTLASHLSNVPVDRLCRLPPSRLASRAIPNIGSIELVTGSAFASDYDALYVSAFPKRAERERSDLIVTRLDAQFAGERCGLAPYRIVGVRDRNGEVVGAAQFSVLPLRGGGMGVGEGEEHEAGFAVPYLQYIYVRHQNRRQDMSEVLHVMTLAVAVADAEEMSAGGGGGGGERGGGRNEEGKERRKKWTVPFTLFETEPPGHGDDEESRAFSVTRAQVHAKGGAVAVVLGERSRSGGDEESTTAISSPHVQPGLEVGDPPLSLVWAVRPSPDPLGAEWEIGELGPKLMAAYYQSLRDEGFPEENIRLAEGMVKERCERREWRLMPLEELKLGHE